MPAPRYLLLKLCYVLLALCNVLLALRDPPPPLGSCQSAIELLPRAGVNEHQDRHPVLPLATQLQPQHPAPQCTAPGPCP